MELTTDPSVNALRSLLIFLLGDRRLAVAFRMVPAPRTATGSAVGDPKKVFHTGGKRGLAVFC